MPTQPRVTRGQTRPGHERTDLPEPRPALLVLRWQGIDETELVPTHVIAETGFPGRPAEALLCRWTWTPAGRGSEVVREDWFRAVDVLDHQPGAEEWREIVARPVWMS